MVIVTKCDNCRTNFPDEGYHELEDGRFKFCSGYCKEVFYEDSPMPAPDPRVSRR